MDLLQLLTRRPAKSVMEPDYVSETDASQPIRGLLKALMERSVDVPAAAVNQSMPAALVRALTGARMPVPSEQTPAAQGGGAGYEFGKSLPDTLMSALMLANPAASAARRAPANQVGAINPNAGKTPTPAQVNALPEAALRGMDDDMLRKLLVQQQSAKQADGHIRAEIARRNAVQMLGLPEGNTAADRARAMGFSTAPKKETYHGSRDVFQEADPSKSDLGVHTGSLDQAEARLRAFAGRGEDFPEGAAVMPLRRDEYKPLLRVKDEGTFHSDSMIPQLAQKGLMDKRKAREIYEEIYADWDKRPQYDDLVRRILKDRDYAGVRYQNAQEGAGESMAFTDPSAIRSRFAAFDPARRDSADILAGLAGTGLLSPLLLKYLQGEPTQ